MANGLGRRFMALENFFSEETQSAYVEGLSYTVQSAELDDLVERWIEEGKVELGGGVVEIKGE